MPAPVIKLIDATSPDAIKIWADKIYVAVIMLQRDLEALIELLGSGPLPGGGGAPTGPAGGVLGGTYPDPSFAVDMATQAELNAVAATIPSLANSVLDGDTAGGDLSGTYPNPNVVGIHSGATPLAIGAITDTQILVRSGSSITSTTIAIAGGALWDEKYVVSRASTDLSDEIVIPGMAGNGDIAGYGGAGTSEEYDTATTGLTWSPTNPDTWDSNTNRLSHLYVRQSTATERFGTKSWTPGSGAFDVRAKLILGNDTTATATIGLHIGSAGNTERLLAMLAGPAGSAFQFQFHSYASGSYTTRGSHWNLSSNVIWARLTRDASNNCLCYFSYDGVAWIRHSIPLSFTFTPAQVGFRIDAVSEAWVDFLRTSV